MVSRLLFSSTSAVWSQSGSAHYAAANAALDADAAAGHSVGLPATAVQYGPFAGAGMAAAYMDGLEALGLRGLLPQQVCFGLQLAVTVPSPSLINIDNLCPLLQIFDSFQAAGCVSQLMFARIDAPRFATIYSAKGHWGLLDQLLFTAAPAAASMAEALDRPSGLPQPSASPSLPSNRNANLGRQTHAPSTDLQHIVHVVKKAASDVLGQDLDGKCRMPCMVAAGIAAQ